MRVTKIITYTLLAMLATWCGACKKEGAKPQADIFYTTSLDGYTVTFTNQTTGAASYKWDFGDGATSTEESPTHTYPGKGKYVPTLYATTAGGVTDEGSTVIHISKSSAVKLDDNSLSDWDSVAHNVVVSGAGGGIFRKAKFDYNSNYIYFYFEMATTVANGDIFDFYLDTDNDPTTGYVTWLFSGSGNDVLLEGAMLQNWLDPFYFSGASQSSFSWAGQTISEFYQIGTVVQDGGILKFEGAFKRAKLKGMTGKGLRLGVTATKSDWSVTLGALPDQTTAAFYLDMSE
ncbi:MAG TPA: PKD domain-containing protein [Puia sp.]|jgi:PKD repeat protein|nr:PKD domain-containing protein [Puia sp.]